MPVVLAAEVSAGLGALTEVTTWIYGQFGNLVTTISNTPLLLLPVGIFGAFSICALAKRFIGA